MRTALHCFKLYLQHLLIITNPNDEPLEISINEYNSALYQAIASSYSDILLPKVEPLQISMALDTENIDLSVGEYLQMSTNECSDDKV